MRLSSTRLRLGSTGAPALVVHLGPPAQAATRGTILFHHGLGGSKEAQEPDLRSLARCGFLAIGIDAAGHGERRSPDIDRRLAAGGLATEEAFLDLVEATSREVGPVLDDLEGRGWSRPGRVGLAGVSMGGFVTYAAIVLDRRIGAAVAFLGSPRWKLDRPASPHRHLSGFAPTALLSLTAGGDAVVPPGAAMDLHALLGPLYEENPGRLSYVEYEGEDHMVSQETWLDMRGKAQRWFLTHLGGAPS